MPFKILTIFLTLIVSSCSIKQTNDSNSNDDETENVWRKGLQKVINTTMATYGMSYQEKNSGDHKRLRANYKIDPLFKCFYLITERVHIVNTQNDEQSHWVNTYQVSLSDIDHRFLKIDSERKQQRKAIKFINGDDPIFKLSIPVDYKRNVLIPMTSVNVKNGTLDVAKTKLVSKIELRFSQFIYAQDAQKLLQRYITYCQSSNNNSRGSTD